MEQRKCWCTEGLRCRTSAEVRCRVAEMQLKGSCAEMEVQRCRSADMKVLQKCRCRCRGGAEMVNRCRGSTEEVQRCRDADVQRCRGALVLIELQICRSAEVQRCRGAVCKI